MMKSDLFTIESLESTLNILRQYETFSVYFIHHSEQDEFDFYYCDRNDPYKMFWLYEGARNEEE